MRLQQSAAGLGPQLLSCRSASGVMVGEGMLRAEDDLTSLRGLCDLIFGSLLLKGEHFILLFTYRGIKVQRLWQGMGAALPTHGFPAR